jgi:hypothetical protein
MDEIVARFGNAWEKDIVPEITGACGGWSKIAVPIYNSRDINRAWIESFVDVGFSGEWVDPCAADQAFGDIDLIDLETTNIKDPDFKTRCVGVDAACRGSE